MSRIEQGVTSIANAAGNYLKLVFFATRVNGLGNEFYELLIHR